MSGLLRRLRAAAPNFQDDLEALLHWELAEDGAVRGRVREIIAEVRAKGDDALLTYTARFDGVEAKSIAELEVPQEALQDAFEALPEAERSALKRPGIALRLTTSASAGMSGATRTNSETFWVS